MQEVSIERAKEIITEPVRFDMGGRSQSLFKFSRLIMEAEVQTLDQIAAIGRDSHDLVHLSGVHKFRYSPCKADELRTFWSTIWDTQVTKELPQLKQYIIDVCELSAYRAGKARRAYGLFFIGETSTRPWRTAEWYEARRRPVVAPLTEFYPYITKQSTEEHEFLLAVDALVPKSLPNWSRADICQDMIVAVLTGEATLENLRDAMPRYIKWFFKKEPSKYGDLSLDTPIYRGDNQGKTLGEAIAAEYR